jgi:hypothetical protein
MLSVNQYADKIMADIRAAVASGRLPAGLDGFAQLHEYCDANEWLIEHVPWSVSDPASQEHADICNAITDEISRRMSIDRRDAAT